MTLPGGVLDEERVSEDRLSREDFSTKEDWLRYCHEGGLDPYEEGARELRGGGTYEQLLAGVFGSTRRTYERAWQARGLSTKLSAAQVKKAYRAVAFANCLGRIMNVPMTITWSTVGKADEAQVAACQHRFLELVRKWLHARKAPALWVWVLERGSRRGLHTHLLLSVPDEFKIAFRGAAGPMLETAIRRPLLNTPASKTMKKEMRSALAVVPQWEWFKYIMKGVDRNLGWKLQGGEPLFFHAKLNVKPSNEGATQLKRVGVSRNLDDASFARWRSLNEFPDMEINADSGALYGSRFYDWFLENRTALALPKKEAEEQAKTGIRLPRSW